MILASVQGLCIVFFSNYNPCKRSKVTDILFQTEWKLCFVYFAFLLIFSYHWEKCLYDSYFNWLVWACVLAEVLVLLIWLSLNSVSHVVGIHVYWLHVSCSPVQRTTLCVVLQYSTRGFSFSWLYILLKSLFHFISFFCNFLGVCLVIPVMYSQGVSSVSCTFL